MSQEQEHEEEQQEQEPSPKIYLKEMLQEAEIWCAALL